jgi:hypothetical protein
MNFRSTATASALDIDDLSPRLHLFSSLIVLKGASGRVCRALGLQRQDQAKYEWLAEPVLSSNVEFNFVMPSSRHLSDLSKVRSQSALQERTTMPSSTGR